jgi:hypothetical protein
VPGIGATRGVPDVAGDASPDTDMALARSAPGGTYMLTPTAGASAGGPSWAGLIALADQEAGHPLGFVNPAIYRIARDPLYHKASTTSPPAAIRRAVSSRWVRSSSATQLRYGAHRALSSASSPGPGLPRW